MSELDDTEIDGIDRHTQREAFGDGEHVSMTIPVRGLNVIFAHVNTVRAETAEVSA